MFGYLLPLLVVSTIFERLNIFLPALDFSLKLSIIILPIVAIVLLINKRLTFNPTLLFPFLALVVLAQLLSIPFSFDPFQSLQVVVFTLLMLVLFYLIVWSTKRTEDLNRLVWAWGVGAVGVSLLGFWQFVRHLLGEDPTLFFENWISAKTLPASTFVQNILGRSFLRAPSTFIDVNTAASFVGIFLILGWAWWLTTKDRKNRVILCAMLVISLLYFVLTFSRTALVGLGVGALVFGYLLLRERINKKMLWGGFLAGLALLIGSLTYFTVSDPARLGSLRERQDYVQGTVEMLTKTNFTGVGAGNFEPYYTTVIKPRQKHGYSHSIILTWLGELGVFGFLANTILIGSIIVVTGRRTKSLKHSSLWYKRLSGLLAAFVTLVFSNIFHAHYGLEFTWVLLGLVVSGYYLAGRPLEGGRRSVDVLGVRVDNVTMKEAVSKVKDIFKSGRKGYVVTPNPEMIMQSRKDAYFREILNGADLANPDGAGILWASRIWGTPLKERVTGTDLFFELCAEASRRGGRVLFLEGPEGLRSSEEAARKLKKRYPKLNIAGTLVVSHKKDKEAISLIKKASRGKDIDLIFVAYGHGKQEPWIKRNLSKVPVKVAIGVGGALDFAAGVQIRAPRVTRALGFEWLYRLVRQPNRLKRQITALVPFIFLTFRESLRS